MAAATIKLFLGQALATQYADLKSAGVLKKKDGSNYRDTTETYTFLTADFMVQKKSGKVISIFIITTKIPALV